MVNVMPDFILPETLFAETIRTIIFKSRPIFIDGYLYIYKVVNLFNLKFEQTIVIKIKATD